MNWFKFLCLMMGFGPKHGEVFRYDETTPMRNCSRARCPNGDCDGIEFQVFFMGARFNYLCPKCGWTSELF